MPLYIPEHRVLVSGDGTVCLSIPKPARKRTGEGWYDSSHHLEYRGCDHGMERILVLGLGYANTNLHFAELFIALVLFSMEAVVADRLYAVEGDV